MVNARSDSTPAPQHYCTTTRIKKSNISTMKKRYIKSLADSKTQDPPNYQVTADKYQLNRSTLPRRARSRAEANFINRQCLTLAEGESLIGHTNKLTVRGMLQTTSIVRNLAEEMLE